MKAVNRKRVRNLLCVLTGVTVVVTGACPTRVVAVASESSEQLYHVEEETVQNLLLEELKEQETETETNEEVRTEAETETETESQTNENVELEEMNFCAGAAVILDADVAAMNREELIELVKNHTSEDVTAESEEDVETETENKELDEDLVMAKVNEYASVREEPDQNSEKLGMLYKDCGGTILEQKDGWTKISSGGVEGWVKDEYLYFGDEAQDVAQEVGMLTAVTNTQSLRVRKEASEDAGVYGLLANQESIEVISEDGDWVTVNYEGKTGYVAAEYVDISFDIDKAESMESILKREHEAEVQKQQAEAAAQAAEAEVIARNAAKEAVLTSASEEDILAALIQCEAGGESYEGQLAVGSVVMNRVRCGGYPNSITEVVYASGQFTPANSNKMNNLIMTGNIKQSCRQAAIEVINGTCNIGDALHFRRAGRKQGYVIGNHVFW